MVVRRALDASRDLLILFIASGGFALPAYFSEKKRWAEHWRRVELEQISLQKTESDMKLTLLQAQVEPHFLFNTLASVRSLVTSDPPRAAQTIDRLLGAFLGRPVAGGWIDHVDATGAPIVDSMPASTLYHVFLAAAEADRVWGEHGRLGKKPADRQ